MNRHVVGLLTLLLVLAVAVRFCRPSGPAAVQPTRAASAPPAGVAVARKAPPSPRIDDIAEQHRTTVRAPALFSLTELEIVHQLASTGTNLSSASRQKLTEIVRCFDEIRGVYEASVVVVDSESPGELKLSIAAYPAAGKRLEELLDAEIKSALSEDEYRAIHEKFGVYFETVFRYFGRYDQSFTIRRREVPGRPTIYEVTGAITPPPGRLGYAGSTYSAHLPLSQLYHDKWRGIAPEIARAFGESLPSE